MQSPYIFCPSCVLEANCHIHKWDESLESICARKSLFVLHILYVYFIYIYIITYILCIIYHIIYIYIQYIIYIYIYIPQDGGVLKGSGSKEGNFAARMFLLTASCLYDMLIAQQQAYTLCYISIGTTPVTSKCLQNCRDQN